MKDKKYAEEAVKYMERHGHHHYDEKAKRTCKVCIELFEKSWSSIVQRGDQDD